MERITPIADGLETKLCDLPGVDGAIVLATCNRVEIYTEVQASPAQDRVDDYLASLTGSDWELINRLEDQDVAPHLFRLACGLESQVVGEREIAGQMRRALGRARRLNTASFVLAQSFDAAIRTSKKVAHKTGLAGRGRSIVAVGLSLIASHMDLAGATAVIVGTGNYAGAVSAALKDRGLGRILVYSESGRAQRFAALHRLEPINNHDLVSALAVADLVVTCRGFSQPAVPLTKVQEALAKRLSGELAILDLAITHDVEAQVADLDGVNVVDLGDIHQAVPEADRTQVEAAERIIADQLEAFNTELSIRGIGSDIAALHAWAHRHVDDELARLGSHPDLDAVRASLTRLSGALIHLPTVLMRTAAAQGREADLLADIHRVIDRKCHG